MRHASESGERSLTQGFSARLRRAPPRGETPLRFSPPSFAASVEKIYLMGAILNNDGLRSAAAAELRQPLHSWPQCSGAD